MSARLFIRNDDVWRLDGAFRFFFESALERGIPVVYAVIPGRMQAALVRFLRKAKAKSPSLLDIVQHGWMHLNHAGEGTGKYEFGASRSLAVQRRDIRQGLSKMRQAFGDHLAPAFVPPYHGYDARTLQVLHQSGLGIFSAGIRSLPQEKALLRLPARVSFSRYEQGQPRLHKASEVLSLLAAQTQGRPLVGVVTHHEDFSNAPGRRELIRFFNGVAALRRRQGWRVLLFSEIWEAYASRH